MVAAEEDVREALVGNRQTQRRCAKQLALEMDAALYLLQTYILPGV